MKTLSLRGRDFISLMDFSREEIETILDTAKQLKLDRANGIHRHLLQDATVFLLFYNRSLRTRNSFEAGIMQLGGHANYLDSEKVYTPAIEGMEKAFVTERVSDVARVLSRFGEAIAIRIFGDPVGWKHGAGNQYIREFAKWADIPVINMEDDRFHPCQGMADLLTMQEKWGSLAGRKVVVSWAYSPSKKKPVSVPHTLMVGCSLLGANVVFAHPKGFELEPGVTARAKENAARYGGSFEETTDMREAFRNADAVYPKSWPSLEFLPPAIAKPDFEGMDKLFEPNRDWKVDEKMMSLAKPDCLYMHCLPADRGYEVTDEVMDGPHSVIFDQAENRMHAQKAVMSLIMR
ncbi:MAG TPA: ornithine carbamoyltransferase [Bacillota bacterium]